MRKSEETRKNDTGVQAAPVKTDAGADRKRLVSLDAFRGLTIFGMLLVNNIMLDTATPRQLRHAGWNEGLNFADFVFPWFLFIVGVAIPYAVASHRKKGLPLWNYDLKVLSRAATLVFLGCLIDSSINRRPAMLYELPITRRVFLAAGFLVAHWAAIKYLPIPGVGVGVFTPSQNIINHFNQVYLQPYHLNGLFSVVTTSALAILGTVAGDILRSEPDNRPRKVGYLALGGIILTLLGWLWSRDIPFSKPLWTSSYVLYSAGLGALVLSFFYLVMDVKGWRWWAFPLVVFGMNAIVAYVAPILVKVYIFQEWMWKMPDGSNLPIGVAIPHWFYVHFGRVPGGWAYTMSYILVCWIVLLQMYRKKVFVRV
jgi:predicted acyltransferase